MGGKGAFIVMQGLTEGERIHGDVRGALLEYEDEDPAVRRDFEAALRAEGIACQMPEFARIES